MDAKVVKFEKIEHFAPMVGGGECSTRALFSPHGGGGDFRPWVQKFFDLTWGESWVQNATLVPPPTMRENDTYGVPLYGIVVSMECVRRTT